MLATSQSLTFWGSPVTPASWFFSIPFLTLQSTAGLSFFFGQRPECGNQVLPWCNCNKSSIRGFFWCTADLTEYFRMWRPLHLNFRHLLLQNSLIFKSYYSVIHFFLSCQSLSFCLLLKSRNPVLLLALFLTKQYRCLKNCLQNLTLKIPFLC